MLRKRNSTEARSQGNSNPEVVWDALQPKDVFTNQILDSYLK